MGITVVVVVVVVVVVIVVVIALCGQRNGWYWWHFICIDGTPLLFIQPAQCQCISITAVAARTAFLQTIVVVVVVIMMDVGIVIKTIRRVAHPLGPMIIIVIMVNIQDFLQVFQGSGIGKMEDNLTSADPLSYTTNGSRVDLEIYQSSRSYRFHYSFTHSYEMRDP